jgi:hypothetical protein
MKTAITLVLLVVLVGGIQFLSADTVTILLAGYEISMSLSVALTCILILFFLAHGVLSSIASLMAWSQHRSLRRQLQRSQESLDTLGLCWQAVVLQDKKGADRHLGVLKKTLKENPLFPYLQGRVCEMKGDMEGARQAYQALMFDPKLSALGIRELTHLPDNQTKDPFQWLSTLSVEQRQEPWAVRALMARALVTADIDGANQLFRAHRRIFDAKESLRMEKAIAAAEAKQSWQVYSDSQKQDQDALAQAQEAFKKAYQRDRSDCSMRSLYAGSLCETDGREALSLMKKILPQGAGFLFVQTLLIQIIRSLPEKERTKTIKSLDIKENSPLYHRLMASAFESLGFVEKLAYHEAEVVRLQPSDNDGLRHAWICDHCQDQSMTWQPVCGNCKTIGSYTMAIAS